VGLASQAYQEIVDQHKLDKENPNFRGPVKTPPGAMSVFTYGERMAYFTSSATDSGSFFDNMVSIPNQDGYVSGNLKYLGGKCAVVQASLMTCQTESALQTS
jgi:hypothetical protein